MKTALTIAGSDSSGGAGIQGDLKTFEAHGVYGMSVITAITAQNTMRVSHIQGLDPLIIEKQIEAIFSDIQVGSVKIGMLYNRRIVHAVLNTLREYNLPHIVLDPVMVSTTGRILLKGDAITMMVEELFPMCQLITPNILEAELITKMPIKTIQDMKKACMRLHKLGPKNILVKGGHLKDTATDIYYNGYDFISYDHERIHNTNTHGTGCALSSAIAANWSKGYPTQRAIQLAKSYITKAIKGGFSIGSGDGPIKHFPKGVYNE